MDLDNSYSSIINRYTPSMQLSSMGIASSCLVALVTLFLALALKRALGTKKAGDKLPPGPWNLPVIGSLHRLLGAPPHRALLRLSRRHGPLMLLRLGQVPTVVVSSAEAAMEVLKVRDAVFADRPHGVTLDIISSGGKGIVLAPYGEHWRQVRKVCVVELLSARQVQRLESIRREEVSRLVESIAATTATTTTRSTPSATAATVNLTQALAVLTNDIIARAVFSGRCRQQEEYLRMLNVVATLAAGLNPVDLFPSWRLVRWLSSGVRRLRKSHAEIVRIVDSIVQERKEQKASASPGAGAEDDDDLLDVLLRLQKEDALGISLTEEIIGVIVSDIFGAATDTTASTIEWAMVELIRHPRAMERAKQEVRVTIGRGRSTLAHADLGSLCYLRMVIKETLRLHPSAAVILRASRESCRLMDYDIPQGIHVYINAFAVARDPKYWDDPEEFKPERFENVSAEVRATVPQLGFIPFGAGRRQCPGALFGTTTIELVLANLLYHFDWTLPDGEIPESLDMDEVFAIVMHRKSNLCLHAALSMPCS